MPKRNLRILVGLGDKGGSEMVGTDNLKYDIEALSTERDAFRK